MTAAMPNDTASATMMPTTMPASRPTTGIAMPAAVMPM